MSAGLMQEPRSPSRAEREPAHEPPCTGCETVTLSNFWPDSLPFLCLVAIAGIIVYLASGI